MAGVRKALIVATDEYGDTKLARLNAPAADARALAEVLQDPSVGAFEVETVLNRTCQEVEIALARFLSAGQARRHPAAPLLLPRREGPQRRAVLRHHRHRPRPC